VCGIIISLFFVVVVGETVYNEIGLNGMDPYCGHY
jgi:hypothetical protein